MTKLEIVLLLIVIVFSLIAIFKRKHHLRLAREESIRRLYVFRQHFGKSPTKLSAFRGQRPRFSRTRFTPVFSDFLRSEKKTISMPSKVVDVLWHEFILDTRRYTDFANKPLAIIFITFRHHQHKTARRLQTV